MIVLSTAACTYTHDTQKGLIKSAHVKLHNLPSDKNQVGASEATALCLSYMRSSSKPLNMQHVPASYL